MPIFKVTVMTVERQCVAYVVAVTPHDAEKWTENAPGDAFDIVRKDHPWTVMLIHPVDDVPAEAIHKCAS